jgi:hypothetical protein
VSTPALAAAEAAGLTHRVIRHGPVRSLAEAAQARGVAPAGVVKTLVVRRGEAQYGLVLRGLNVLAVVTGASGALTPTAIAERTFVGKTTVTSVLDALERRRLVRRCRRASFVLTQDLRVSYICHATKS